MKPYTWSPDQTLEEQKNGAYWERNMLALLLAIVMNNFNDHELTPICGWYKHEGDGFDGWSRVISIGRGDATFHVPDEFDLGKLPEIQANWNGHTTEEKWHFLMGQCGIGLTEVLTEAEQNEGIADESRQSNGAPKELP